MMNPTVRRATKRTIGALVVSVATLLSTPLLSAAAHNPIFSFSLLLATLVILYRVWSACASDAQIATFHLLVNVVTVVKVFRQEFLTFDPDVAQNEARRRNRKLVRAAILFLMAQKVLIPQHSLAWIYSLLAYKFVLDFSVWASRALRRVLRERRRRRGNQAQGPDGSDHVAEPEVDTAQASDAAASRSDTPQHAARRRVLPRVHLLGIQVFKLSFAAAVLQHQTLNLPLTYILTTLTYFLLSHNVLHHPLTFTLESLQLEYFEGLEQYYVTGFLGVLEVLYSVLFMVLNLLDSRQVLMMAALYTNIYTCARELSHESVHTAFAEWTVLAHFQKATQRELRELNDVCAICLADMWTARKTPCQHYFHGRCLRKCLRERAACPMCFTRFDFYRR